MDLPNDVLRTITIMVEDTAGDKVPAPAGDVFHVVSSDPASLNAVIGTDASGAPAMIINALVPLGGPFTTTVSDDAGLKQEVDSWDLVADVTPTSIVLDFANAVDTAQPVPAAAPAGP